MGRGGGARRPSCRHGKQQDSDVQARRETGRWGSNTVVDIQVKQCWPICTLRVLANAQVVIYILNVYFGPGATASWSMWSRGGLFRSVVSFSQCNMGFALIRHFLPRVRTL